MNSPATRLDLVRWLYGHTRELLAPLLGSVLARIAGQLLGVALFVLVAGGIVAAAQGEPRPLPELAGWLVGLAIAKALLRYLEHYLGHWVAFTALERLRELFFARLVPLAPAATRGAAGSELTGRATSDIDRIEVFFAHTGPPAVAAVVVPAVALGWLGLSVDARLALALAPFVVVALLLPFALAALTRRSARAVAARRAELAVRLGDDIQGVREVLAFDLAGSRLAGLAEADDRLLAARSRAGLVQGGRTAVTALLQGFGILALVAAAARVGSGAPSLAIALAVAISLWGPTRSVDDFAAGFDAAMAATARVRTVVDARPTVTGPARPVPVPPPGSGTVLRLDGVDFSYPGTARPALAGLTIDIEEGAWVTVVGVSGSGKSTLANLILRGWDPDAGAVLFRDQDVRALALSDLRSRVALVSQRPVMMSGTVADNLRLAAPDATDADLAAALATAGLTEWSATLPAGLDTRLSERGLNLSGGQLQRLALARALLGRPDVLILDEALSQLDGVTAARVRAGLARCRAEGGLTVVEITHRADLVPDEAQVFLLDGGRLVEAGTAGDLRARGGGFVRLAARDA